MTRTIGLLFGIFAGILLTWSLVNWVMIMWLTSGGR